MTEFSQGSQPHLRLLRSQTDDFTEEILEDGRSRILLVDDDVEILRSLEELLESEGPYRIRSCSDAKRVAAAAREFRPDVVLLDIRLGHKSGLDLLPVLKREVPGLICILMTGHDALDYAIRALRAGADDYLRKPTDPDGLLDKISGHLERRRLEHEKLKYQRRFQAIFNQSSQTLFLIDETGGLLEANESALEFAGVTREAVRGQPLWQTPWWNSSDVEQARLEAAVREALEGDDVRYEAIIKGLRGRTLTLDLSLKPVLDQDGKVDVLLAEGSDITRLKRAVQNLEQLAHYDSLTGLPNRNLFCLLLEKSISRAVRKGRMLAVFFLDLDDFKRVNDTLGHDVGDRLLAAVGDRLKKSVREEDAVCRWSGDEFCLFSTELAETKSAAVVAGKTLEAFARPFQLEHRSIAASVSIGVALLPLNGNDVPSLVKAADRAMYQAKGRGGSQYSFLREEPETRGGRRQPQ